MYIDFQRSHRCQTSGEQLATLARASPCLQQRLSSQPASVRAILPAPVNVSQWVTRIILVIQSPLGVKAHFSLGVAHNFQTLQCTLPMRETRSPWSCMLEIRHVTSNFPWQQHVECPTQKSVDRTCPQPNPKSQPHDGNTLKLQHGTCTSSPARFSHRL